VVVQIVNSSTEFWSCDGTSLHQFGWSVTTVGGDRYNVPTRRGSNIDYAYLPGSLHRNKTPMSRPMALLMWLTASDPATGIPAADPTLQWNDSWDFLRRLFWKPSGSQVTLTRRWRLSSEGGLFSADAQAELVGTMNPAMTGRYRADFAVEFLLADPFFYGAQETQNLTLNVTHPVTNKGHDVSKSAFMSIDLVGPLTNPTLTNLTTAPTTSFTYTGTIAAGSTLKVNVSQFQALLSPALTNQIAKITHSGNRNWFALNPGVNNVKLTASSGTGSGVLRWRAPYI
jgi:hypothetical protein